eukprot:jgi/Picre1/29684/NNA_005067.t1
MSRDRRGLFELPFRRDWILSPPFLHESQLCSKLQSHVTSGSIPEQSRHYSNFETSFCRTELTVSYIDENEDYEERQKQLQDYGFECTCAKCLAHE